ncbi:hypothetical protein A2U01_0105404, partial [Trifolium medium]|nr:hypothetical protein [Trifolium medium]
DGIILTQQRLLTSSLLPASSRSTTPTTPGVSKSASNANVFQSFPVKSVRTEPWTAAESTKGHSEKKGL